MTAENPGRAAVWVGQDVGGDKGRGRGCVGLVGDLDEVVADQVLGGIQPTQGSLPGGGDVAGGYAGRISTGEGSLSRSLTSARYLFASPSATSRT